MAPATPICGAALEQQDFSGVDAIGVMSTAIEGTTTSRYFSPIRGDRGFKNMKNFIAMIYFVCGNLEIPTSTIM
jgi:hypothetical protein